MRARRGGHLKTSLLGSSGLSTPLAARERSRFAAAATARPPDGAGTRVPMKRPRGGWPSGVAAAAHQPPPPRRAPPPDHAGPPPRDWAGPAAACAPPPPAAPRGIDGYQQMARLLAGHPLYNEAGEAPPAAARLPPPVGGGELWPARASAHAAPPRAAAASPPAGDTLRPGGTSAVAAPRAALPPSPAHSFSPGTATIARDFDAPASRAPSRVTARGPASPAPLPWDPPERTPRATSDADDAAAPLSV